MDFKFMIEILPEFLSVLHVTILIIISASTLGLILSIFVTMIRIKEIKYLSKIMTLYISFTRSVPIVLQLFLVYYALPILFSLVGINISNISAVIATIFALTLYNGGYLAEVIRPAYLAVERGQHEAALSLGYTPFQKFTRIIVPQVIPIALPGWGNALIYLIHDTSLIFVIGVLDIMGVANLLISQSYGSNQVEIFLTIAILFWILCLISDNLVRFLEKRVKYSQIGSGIKQ